MNRSRIAVLVLGLGAAGSQAGHLLAYWIRFGGASWSIQSTGAHAYLPSLVKMAAGGVSAAVVACLLAIGLARVVAGRPVVRDGAVPYVRLLAAIFTVQMACFALQESIEAGLGAAPGVTAAGVVLWGTLGQLPVALLAALALRWLSARLGPSIRVLARHLGMARLAPAAPAVVTIQPGLEPGLVRARPFAFGFSTRAPPRRSS